MIWGKAIVLCLAATVLSIGEDKKGGMEKKGEWDKEGEGKGREGMDKEVWMQKKGGMDKEDLGKEGGMSRKDMNKEHDNVDLCMFTVDDEQCSKVDGCSVISWEDYMARKKEVMGEDMREEREGGGRMSGSGRRGPRGGDEGRRRLMGKGPREGGEGKGPREGGEGKGPREGGEGEDRRGPMGSGRGRMSGSGRMRMSGSGRGRMSGSGRMRKENMCISQCYLRDIDVCGDDCMVHKMPVKDMREGGDRKDDRGRMSGSGRGRMSGSGRRGPMKEGGRRLLEERREGPMRGSGRGRMSGSGRGRMSGSGMKREYMQYCGPKMETEIKTGLGVKVTFFTDEKCSEMLEVPEMKKEDWGKKDDEKEGRRRLQRKDRGKKGEEAEKEGEDKMGEDDRKGPMDDKKEGMDDKKGGMDDKKGEMMKSKGPMMRVRENPSMRVIPVIDGEGQTKCSFDARSDREMGRFRQTTCVDDNVLGVTTFDDVLCSQKSERPAAVPLIFRGECMQLPMPGMKKEGDDEKKGPKDGRRRLMEKEGMKGKKPMDDKEGEDKEGGMFDDWEMCSEEKGNNSLTDFLKGLMCEESEDEDDEDDMSDDDENESYDKDDKKDWGDKKEEMEMKPLYVTYEWQYLMKDGEKTTEAYCFKEETKPDAISSVDDFNAYCEDMEKCSGICKSSKEKLSKEEKKQGKKAVTQCLPSKKVIKKGKVKCKKVGGDMCAMFEGCKTSEKKGKVKCSGSANLN